MREGTKACLQGLALPQQMSLSSQDVLGRGHFPYLAPLHLWPLAQPRPTCNLPAICKHSLNAAVGMPPLPFLAFEMRVRRHDPTSSPQTARPHLVELEVQPLQLGQVRQVAPHQVSQLQPLLLATLPGGQDSSTLRQAALGLKATGWQHDRVKRLSAAQGSMQECEGSSSTGHRAAVQEQPQDGAGNLASCSMSCSYSCL